LYSPTAQKVLKHYEYNAEQEEGEFEISSGASKPSNAVISDIKPDSEYK
jgi:hypothetical protein